MITSLVCNYVFVCSMCLFCGVSLNKATNRHPVQNMCNHISYIAHILPTVIVLSSTLSSMYAFPGAFGLNIIPHSTLPLFVT